MLVAGSVGAAAERVPAASVAAGRVSGAIVADGGAVYPVNADGIRALVRVTARTPDGTSVGTFRFGGVRTAADGTVRVTYAIDGLPLHVALRVSAEHVTASAPSPWPTGFFRTFVLTKTAPDPPFDAYLVTLDPAHAAVDVCDFHDGDIEVPPALPAGTPAPAATAPATRERRRYTASTARSARPAGRVLRA